MVKIRKATLKDLDVLYNLNVELAKYEFRFDPVKKKPRKKKRYIHSYEDLRKKLKKKDCHFFIAEDQGKTIGFIEGCVENSPPFYKYPRKGNIGPTFIKKEYRNKGVGKKLVKEMLGRFKSKNIKWIQITTHAKNTKSIKFWKKMGFKEYSVRMNLLF